MSRRKEKLVLKKAFNTKSYVIAKSVNTTRFGMPGDAITKEAADKIITDNLHCINRGVLAVEFIF